MIIKLKSHKQKKKEKKEGIGGIRTHDLESASQIESRSKIKDDIQRGHSSKSCESVRAGTEDPLIIYGIN